MKDLIIVWLDDSLVHANIRLMTNAKVLTTEEVFIENNDGNNLLSSLSFSLWEQPPLLSFIQSLRTTSFALFYSVSENNVLCSLLFSI